MRNAVRSLAPFAAIAFVMALLLAVWIRAQPVELHRAEQLVLTSGLVIAVAGTFTLAWRKET